MKCTFIPRFLKIDVEREREIDCRCISKFLLFFIILALIVRSKTLLMLQTVTSKINSSTRMFEVTSNLKHFILNSFANTFYFYLLSTKIGSCSDVIRVNIKTNETYQSFGK